MVPIIKIHFQRIGVGVLSIFWIPALRSALVGMTSYVLADGSSSLTNSPLTSKSKFGTS
jgi:hypothetical protein